MDFEKQLSGDALTYLLKGRLDTATSPAFETELRQSIGGVKHLVLDLTDLTYMSSSGLRVLLAAQKAMSQQGDLVVRHVNDTIAEVFEITGFSDILTIEA